MTNSLPLLVEVFWKSGVLLGAAWCAAGLLRKKSADVRRVVLSTAIVALFAAAGASRALPRWTAVRPTWHYALPPSAVTSAATIASEFEVQDQTVGRTAAASGVERQSASGMPDPIALIWGAGMAIFLIRLTIGLFGLRRLRDSSVPLRESGLPSAIPLLENDSLAAPVTWGIFRPVILVPPHFRQLPDESRNAILCHELGHVEGGDFSIRVLADAARALIWFQPLVWIVRRRLRLEQELACDNRVVAVGGKPSVYAKLLMDWDIGRPRRTARLAVGMAQESCLKRRLYALLDRDLERGVVSRKGVIATVCGGFALAMFTATMSVTFVAAAVPRAGSAQPVRPQVAQQQLPQQQRPVAPPPFVKTETAVAPLRPPVIPPIVAQNTLAQNTATPQVPSPPVAASTPGFNVASIRLNKDCGGGAGRGGGVPARSLGRLHITCASVQSLIENAYVVADANGRRPARGASIEGGPAWIESDAYAIDAEADGAPNEDMMRGPMMQALLEDRFHLKIHRETREIPVYVLTVAKGGPKLKPFQEGSCTEHVPGAARPGPGEKPWCGTGGMRIVRNGRNVTWDEVGASFLNFSVFFGIVLDRPVIDKTGITGMFDFHLEFAPDETTSGVASPFAPDRSLQGAPPDPAGGPSIFTAFQDQLGLKLESGKGPSEVLVIDHVERPSEN